MRKIAVYTLVAVLLLATVSSIQLRSAHAIDAAALLLLEDSNPSDGVITLGEDITAKVLVVGSDVDNVTFTWIRPDSSIARTQNVALSGGEVYDTFIPDMLGTWIVRADFNDGVTIVITLDVTFQVIPESIIGAIAPVTAGLAAFIGYRYYSRSGRSRQ